ncbi:molybdopterin-synthase adenylyltransferase MoeB [Pseudobacteriovorax antillogorgiicola]|uniref:Molybdopterin-synthase adenylyltransferase n=1 Tax=Pseudobacteriovorax antillogorgiicola TaxID=1513793 RepID=A0A1Y6CDX5_9BACT|nr:molybdopterin-synthase adenylyltransferase MoeB [Pseudobacteriovorax antillogorgiicola]TCS51684.1 molybdopterin/thiamine biosynthesis adenylyltransferase [Pseudobacteriovorax antillogorgiicola]SMF49059.1 Molybdopterin or thiamine biosynthesis adenylyltransferase [Pseudobacteriovorax antillogorgiicola]
MTVQNYLETLRQEIEEVSVQQAADILSKGSAALIDVRELDEYSSGIIANALRLGRGFLELRIEKQVPDKGQTVLVYCAGGTRSLMAAKSLKDLGYQNVKSIAGGFNGWKTSGFPFEQVKTLSIAEKERYSRHLLLPEIGEEGQLRLKESKVLLVGAGGLGSPIALYLAAAGVGTIGLVDDDRVDRSNLQRQIIHQDRSVGEAKTTSAKSAIQNLNPETSVNEYQLRLSSNNVEEIFSGYDIIVDGSDNFATRYLINDACIKLGLPQVHGSIFRFEGQVSVFRPRQEGVESPCYRCLFPEPPPPEQAPSCAEAGVIGALPGVIGLLQALEALKLILEIGQPLVGRLLLFNGLDTQFRELRLHRDPDCRYCDPHKEFPGYMDYQEFCRTQ